MAEGFCAKVCAASGVRPEDVVYVEAHGTGTVVGDSQELAAIDGLYGIGAGHTPGQPLLIGSVKSNMGHCEGCSGLAGVPPYLPALLLHLLPQGSGYPKLKSSLWQCAGCFGLSSAPQPCNRQCICM